jgi:hypothetical protein
MSANTTFQIARIENKLNFVTFGNANITSVVATTPSASHTVTLPDPGGSDSFLLASLAQTYSNKTWGSNMAAGGYKLTGLGTPTISTDAVNKSYADGLIVGLDIHAACQCATIAALPAGTYTGTPTFTFAVTATGTLTIDGYLTVLNDRILVQNQASPSQNGIYVVTTAGAGGVAAVLTRASDYNTSALIDKTAFTFIQNGTVNGDQGFASTQGSAAVLDSNSITFTQFTGGSVYTQGNGISISSNIITAVGDGTTITVSGSGIAVSATYGGNTSLNTLGTVSTGTWAATTLAVNHGGTGQTSASAAFNALSPVTTTGDLIIGNGTNTQTRLGIGANHTVLYSGGTTASWANVDSASFGSNVLAVAQGGTGSATATNPSWFGATGSTTPAFQTGALPIAVGGSGQTTAAAALTAFGGQPLQQNILTKSANYTTTATDYIIQFTTSTSALVNTTVTPGSGNKGIVYTVVKADSALGSVAITPASGTINGAASYVLDNQYDSVSYYTDATNFFTI